jgi:hypothetical protein
VKAFGLTEKLPIKLYGLRMEEESGTAGVRVKSVDIGRNASGEVGSLVHS